MKIQSITCPFCDNVFPTIKESYVLRYPSFKFCDSVEQSRTYQIDINTIKDLIAVEFALCPSCEKTSIRIIGIGDEVSGINHNFHPSSNAKQYPSYIPVSIIQDYEEACKIVNLSPKASATLSRRCLQGMIRDYWSISDKLNLYQEIEAIQDRIDPQVSKVLNGVRQLGNIGAHMEKDINLVIDIEPDEAKQLIKLIEYLIAQWYIKRYDSEELLQSILDINCNKQDQRTT